MPSLAQELEARVVRSFELDEAFDAANLRFFHALATRLDLVQRVTGADHWTESYVAWHAVRELLPEVLKEFRPVPPMVEAIVGTVTDEQTAKAAVHAEWERLKALRPPRPAQPRNALAGLGDILQDALEDPLGPIETPENGTSRSDEEIAAINEQQKRTDAAHEAWRAARIGAEAAWAEADRQAAKGTALARRIIELGNQYDALQR